MLLIQGRKSMNKILDIQKLNISVDNLLSQKKLISDISLCYFLLQVVKMKKTGKKKE